MTRRPSQSERLAESLRDDPPELDDVARVRMERALLEARRAGAGVSKRGPGFAWGLGLGIAAAAAILLVWRAASPAPHASAPSASLAKGAGVTARIERWQGGERVDAGGLREGMRVLTGELERARLSLGRSRIELSPDSLLVPERMQSDVRMRLERGEVRVEFNPEHPGQEGFVLETESARVEVVGTAFRVRVAADGSTDVTVEHGVVRVSPLPFGGARRLLAGETLHVESRGHQPMRDFALASAFAPSGEEEHAAAESNEADTIATSPAGHAQAADAPALDTMEVPPSAPTAVAAPAPDTRPTRALDADARFELALRFTEHGQYEEARHELYAIVRSGQSREQARAWSMVADTREREQDWAGAGEAYRRAADAETSGVFGSTALFALARLRENRLHDPAGARQAYRAYLQVGAGAPLAQQARLGLCRLGDLSLCGPGQEPVEPPPR